MKKLKRNVLIIATPLTPETGQCTRNREARRCSNFRGALWCYSDSCGIYTRDRLMVSFITLL